MSMEPPRPWFILPGASRPEPSLPSEMPSRIPTGVPDFDPMTGGIPSGSVVLLLGEAGAGHQEFALTSAVHLMLHYDDPLMHEFYLGSAKGPFVYPRGVVYVSVTRSRDQVLNEVQGAFGTSYHDVLSRHLTFHDLSPSYFADSVVPSSWSSLRSSLLSGHSEAKLGENGPLRGIADALETNAGTSLVIIDSLTDLLVRRGIEVEDLLTLVKGLRRRAKTWNGLVYLILSRGVAPAAIEQALVDSVDGVLTFAWSSSASHSTRQRTMLIEKFMPVLARVPHEHQGRFVIRVGALNGLVTTQYERV
jgi:KaiC/GvpD/RAD55 family RecA-like ATPase